MLVPFAGLRSYSAASVSGLGRYTELWSSSPTSASDPASRDLGLNVSGDMGKGSYYHAYGASVRCFYNEYAEYLVPASSYTLTLNPNGGEVE